MISVERRSADIGTAMREARSPVIWIGSWALDAIAVCSILLMLGLRLESLEQPISGPDGGNWLALAGGLIGTHPNAASTVYPPGYLIHLLLAQLLYPALDALRVSGAVASVLPGIACYCLLRAMGLRVAALGGLGASLTGFSLEMLAWGGYPQLMGTGLSVGSVAAFLRAFRSGETRYAILAGLLAGSAALTHQLAGIQTALCLATAGGVSVASGGAEWRPRLKLGLATLLTGVITIVPGVPTYFALITHAGPSALNANGFTTIQELLAYLCNESPVLWVVLAASTPIALGLMARERRWIESAALLGLAGSSIGLGLLSFEVRVFYLAQILALVASAVLVARLTHDAARAWRAALGAAVCALWLTLALAGTQRFDRTLRFYSVLDAPLVDGLQWIGAHRRPGDLAAVGPGREKWPLGWWVQGIGRVPSYLDYDPRWLYFREEKAQADTARSILRSSDPQLAAIEAQRNGITLLIFDVRQPGQADKWLDSGRVFGQIGLVYSNPSLVVFRVAKADGG